jgi:hypothetical protein
MPGWGVGGVWRAIGRCGQIGFVDDMHGAGFPLYGNERKRSSADADVMFLSPAGDNKPKVCGISAQMAWQRSLSQGLGSAKPPDIPSCGSIRMHRLLSCLFFSTKPE